MPLGHDLWQACRDSNGNSTELYGSATVPQIEVSRRTATGDAARNRLLDAAERLFARRGAGAVSLREIAAEAGQRNVSAVSYHFGDKQGLIDALINDRMARVDDARQRLLERVEDLEAERSEELLRLLWQPVLDLNQAEAIHWFVDYQRLSGAMLGPTSFYPAAYPASARIHDALGARCPHLPPGQFRYRMNLVAMMFWSAASWHDDLARAANQHWSSRFSLTEVVKVAVAALLAPA